MSLHRFRLSEAQYAELANIASSMVQPGERHKNQRPDTSLVGPMIRLIVKGAVIPVRLPNGDDQLGVLETLLRIYVDEGTNISDPVSVNQALGVLLDRLATGQLKLIGG